MNDKVITLIDEFGTEKQANIILKFYSEKHKKCYMLYNFDEDKDKCYAASFLNIDGMVDLNNDLTEEELNMLQNLVDQRRAGVE